MRALERAGVRVQRIAMRPADVALVDPQDKEEAHATQYVLEIGAWRLMLCMLQVAVRRPGAYLRALRCAWQVGKRAPQGPWRHLIYLAEACRVLTLCQGADHLHAHFGTNAAAVAMLTRLLGGPSYSFTVHGPEEFDDPKGLSLETKIAHAAFVVAISQFGRSQLFRWAKAADWPKIKVVHCGIEPAAFADPPPLPEGPRQLVSIGRFAEQKGQLVLIEALAACSTSDVRLVLVGDGDMRPELEQAIRHHGLQDRVVLTGWLNEAEVRRELAAAQALILPSFAEGLPMVIMEAMAAARPVLSTFIAGTPELVLPNQTGWLVPAGDVQALAEAIDTYAGLAPETLAQMGQAGRARVLERHDIDDQAARLLTFMRG